MNFEKGISPRTVLIVVLVLIMALIGIRIIYRVNERIHGRNAGYQSLEDKLKIKESRGAAGIMSADNMAAAEKLIAPYKFGGAFKDGMKFYNLEKNDAENIVIKLSGKSNGEGMFLWLSKRDGSKTSMARSKHFNIVCIAENKQGLVGRDKQIADNLTALIRKNDGGAKTQSIPPEKNSELFIGGECEGVNVKAVKFDKAKLTISKKNGEHINVTAELAVSAAQQCAGLSGRANPGGGGMLFVFKGDGAPSFDTRNMLFTVDMIFIAANGEIVGIDGAVNPDSMEMHTAPLPIRYMLETAGGFSEKNGIEPGGRVNIPNLY
jgi:uncharacterized protein